MTDFSLHPSEGVQYMYCMYTVHWTNRPVTDYSEAEFLDVIGIKALRVFLLAIHEFGFCSEFSEYADCLNKLYLRIMTTDHLKNLPKKGWLNFIDIDYASREIISCHFQTTTTEECAKFSPQPVYTEVQVKEIYM